MASIARDRNGTTRILFTLDGDRRKTVRLGRVPVKTAEAVRLRVEALVAARLGVPVDRDTAAWVGSLPDRVHSRLARAGLVEPREAAIVPTLGDLLKRFEETLTVKGSTRLAYRQAVGSLRGHFGDAKRLDSLTTADADAWKKALADSGLATATVAKRINVAKTIFRKATRWGLIPASPWADLKPGSQSNPDRSIYVPRESIRAVLEACPDDEWRAVVALVRYAGLRCPSELVLLRWGDRYRFTR